MLVGMSYNRAVFSLTIQQTDLRNSPRPSKKYVYVHPDIGFGLEAVFFGSSDCWVQ